MFEIRIANSRDAHAIAKVHVQAWHETYAGLIADALLDKLTVSGREQNWQRTLELAETKADTFSQTHVFVAVFNQQVVGFSSAGMSRLDGMEGEIFTLYVLKDFQGMGIGRALFMAALDTLRQQGLRRIIVGVLETNPSRAFYEHMGGKVQNYWKSEFFGQELPEVGYIFVL